MFDTYMIVDKNDRLYINIHDNNPVVAILPYIDTNLQMMRDYLAQIQDDRNINGFRIVHVREVQAV